MTDPDPIVIGPPYFRENGEFIRSVFPVQGLPESELWFDVDAQYSDFLSDTCDAALTSLLIAAMDGGKPIRVTGPVSAELLWGIRNTVIPSVLANKPFLSSTTIHAEEIREDTSPPGDAVLAGFSCGVDSFSAVQDHWMAEGILPTHRITHLVQAHIGHNGYGPEVDDRARSRWRNVEKAADEIGLPAFRVSSNQPSFYSPRYDDRLNWISTITVRFSALPLLLQKGVRRFYLASSHTWREIGSGRFRDMSRMDPILLPALSTPRIQLLAVGTEHSRVEKTRRIADYEVAQHHLDVCIQTGDTNCSRCEKCLRTMLTLDLLGRLEKFGTRFDLAEYRKKRTEFVSEVWLDHLDDHCHLEIKELMDQIGFKPDAAARLRIWAMRAWRLLPSGLRRRLRDYEES